VTHYRYENVRRCVNCHGHLSYSEVMYSDGRCPLCGYKAEGACTISLDTMDRNKADRLIQLHMKDKHPNLCEGETP
jgi:hypothetical protein